MRLELLTNVPSHVSTYLVGIAHLGASYRLGYHHIGWHRDQSSLLGGASLMGAVHFKTATHGLSVVLDGHSLEFFVI